MELVNVTFLFTDIEGSTRLWEDHPQAMMKALARHDALLRACIVKNEGRVFKTVGDAFFAAFPSAIDALNTCVESQQQLVAEDWGDMPPIKVRMAIHTGEAEARDNDFFGQPLNRVARLLSVGHGGQMLVSKVTYDLLEGVLPDGVTLEDMGHHRLKDLQQAENVFQVMVPGLPHEFPALKSLQASATNLPPQVTSFIGREKEIAEVNEALKTAKLLTLTGSGGTGKTRLMLQVAADLVEQYRDGVWQVELAALTDPGLVAQTVASVLRLREEPGRPITDTLVDYLRSKRLLLLIDNCEHVLYGTGDLLATIVRNCPEIQVIASSREALGVTGEVNFRVPSLSVPAPDPLMTPTKLGEYASVKLFVDRAQNVQPTFGLTVANTPVVAKLCNRLDGIPLALELAAARMRVMSVEQIEERLNDRFRLLTGGSRTVLPRQQTLRALIDWSYDLLNPSEKTLLLRLSVFAGGSTLESSEAVCSGGDVEQWEVLDLLTALVDKSLVVYEVRNGSPRYRLLETVRQYSRDRMLESGESGEHRRKHRDYFLGLAEKAKVRLYGPEQATYLNILETEIDNFRSAIEWCVGEDDLEVPREVPEQEANSRQVGLRLTGALWQFWFIRGYFREGRELLESVLFRVDSQLPTMTRSDALSGAGNLARIEGEYDKAKQYHQESLEIRRSLGDKRGIAASHVNLGVVAFESGDQESAKHLFEEALAIFRELGHKPSIATLLTNLGEVAQRQARNDRIQAGTGDDPIWRAGMDRARALTEESLAISRELGDKDRIGLALSNLGPLACQMKDYEAARRYLTECLGLFMELGDRRSVAIALSGFSDLYRGTGDIIRAIRLESAGGYIRETVGAPIPISEKEDYDKQIAQMREAVGVAIFEEAWQAGRLLSIEEMLYEATNGQ